MVQQCLLGMLLLVVYVTSQETMSNEMNTEWQEDFNKTANVQPGKRLAKLLKHILKNYDKEIRPLYGVKALNVTVDVLVISFGEINEANMVYIVDIYLGQFWNDPRFALGIDQNFTIGDELVHKIWTPDTFVVNAVKTQVHRLTKENQKIYMNLTDGFVMHVSRLRLTVSCRMNLRDYPKDKQTCSLPFESYTYDALELTYTWRKQSQIQVFDKEMAQFTVEAVDRHERDEKYTSEHFSGLTVKFTFQRRWIYYIYQVYVPCICITVLSWIGFWIDHNAVPARTGLGITTVLTMVYMLASVNSNLPRVTYLKSIDYFVLGCFAFIFLTSIEYVVAIRFSRYRRNRRQRMQQEKAEDVVDDRAPISVQVTQGGKIMSFHEKQPSFESATNGHTHAVNGNSRPPLTRADSAKSGTLLYTHVLKARRQSTKFATSIRNRASPIHRMVTKVSHHENMVDMVSRVLFPLAFVVFNTIYWIGFVNM